MNRFYYVIACSLDPSVADDPSGATDCTTHAHGINPKLVILLVDFIYKEFTSVNKFWNLCAVSKLCIIKCKITAL